MATVYQEFSPEAACFPSANFCQYLKPMGTNFPIGVLAYDAATDEEAFWNFEATNYGSGNLTARVYWYADTATSGDVVLGCSIAAITANTDTQDVETDALTTENTVTDSHLGTTGQRLHSADVTISNLDSLANRDWVTLRLRRVGSNGSDTMAGDCYVVKLVLSYSDT
jgi:hypothetical protein